MNAEKMALTLYMLGSICFLAGSAVTWWVKFR